MNHRGENISGEDCCQGWNRQTNCSRLNQSDVASTHQPHTTDNNNKTYVTWAEAEGESDPANRTKLRQQADYNAPTPSAKPNSSGQISSTPYEANQFQRRTGQAENNIETARLRLFALLHRRLCLPVGNANGLGYLPSLL